MKIINIGILGLGAVGLEIVQIIENNYQKIALKTGQQIVIKKNLVHDLSLCKNYRDKYSTHKFITCKRLKATKL